MSTLGGGTLGSGSLKDAFANTLGAGTLGGGYLGDAAYTQNVTPTGFLAESITGAHWIADARRYAYPLSVDSFQAPAPFVAFEIRYMHPLPVQQEQFGPAIVDQQNKELYPATFASTSFGTPFASFKDRAINAGAGSLLIVPIHAVFDPRQHIHQSGQAGGIVSSPAATNRNVELRLPSINSFSPGVARPYSLWQVVLHVEDYQFPGDVGAATVTNFNKTLYPEGIASLRMRPYHEARLGADAASAVGADSFESGDSVVSNYYRSIPVDGIDAFGGSRSTVSNAAIGVYAVGTRNDQHGAHEAVDGTREVYPLLPRQDSYGNARASLSPIVVTEVQGVSGAAHAPPRVSVSPLVATPVWAADAITGAALLQIRFNRVEPLAFPSNTPPAPTVVNRNRYVRPFAPIEEFGLHRAVLMRQFVSQSGAAMTYFGAHLARDRTTRITPVGIVEPSTTGATVNKYPPDPPPNLIIRPTGIDGHVPIPSVIGFSVYPIWSDSGEVNQPRIFSNTIVVPGIIEDHTANTLHTIPSTAPITVLGFSSAGYGTHDCSPRTIWATYDAPPQAIANNGGAWSSVDADIAPAPGVGEPFASNINREVRPEPTNNNNIGDASALNKRQVVVAIGFLSQRVPAPKIPNPGPVRIYGINALELGYPYAAFAVDAQTQSVICVGIYGSVYAPVISNYTRELPIDGVNSEAFGPAFANHELPPFRMSGFDGLAFGDSTDVGHQIRSFYVEGFDGALMGPTVGDFARGLKVIRLDRIRPQWAAQAGFGLVVAGHSSRSVGVTDIAPPPVMPPRLQHTAAASGWSADMIGAHRADVVIDGSVLAYGMDDLWIGRPATNFMLHIESVLGAVGSVSVADAIVAIGIYGEIGSAAAVGGAGHTCGMAPRAVVSGSIDTAVIGEPSLV